jgi:Protein of unknown function (DUF3768)
MAAGAVNSKPNPSIHRRHNHVYGHGPHTCAQRLNDQLRRHLTSGKAVMTPGVAALGSEAVQRLIQTIAIFDDFCTANDPHGEHDFGAFEFEGAPIMFKIDYYDKNLNFHSPNPADPAVTEPVLTIMLAEEY